MIKMIKDKPDSTNLYPIMTVKELPKKTKEYDIRYANMLKKELYHDLLNLKLIREIVDEMVNDLDENTYNEIK